MVNFSLCLSCFESVGFQTNMILDILDRTMDPADPQDPLFIFNFGCVLIGYILSSLCASSVTSGLGHFVHSGFLVFSKEL